MEEVTQQHLTVSQFDCNEWREENFVAPRSRRVITSGFSRSDDGRLDVAETKKLHDGAYDALPVFFTGRAGEAERRRKLQILADLMPAAAAGSSVRYVVQQAVQLAVFIEPCAKTTWGLWDQDYPSPPLPLIGVPGIRITSPLFLDNVTLP